MFNKASSQWAPYVIPEAPNVGDGEKYFLRLADGAISGTNPSKFLQWEQVTLPEGQNLGDLLYWDPSSGEEGAWVVLAAPEGEGLKVLASNGGTPFWNATEDCL